MALPAADSFRQQPQRQLTPAVDTIVGQCSPFYDRFSIFLNSNSGGKFESDNFQIFWRRLIFVAANLKMWKFATHFQL
jgi:hypothetical protein